VSILIRTLGGLTIVADDADIDVDHLSSRRLALLAVLATSRQGISRDALLPLFWPDSAEERARNALNQALFVLRRKLPPGAIIAGPGVLLRLDPDLVVSDAALFAQAIESDRLDQAAALYGGEFLEGIHIRDAAGFNEWRDAEALRLAQQHTAALETLAERAELRGDHLAALAWWKTLAASDPGSSRIALRLMAAHVAARDPAGALRHARTHETLLAEEFGVPPDPDIQAFARRIRAGGTNGVAAPPPEQENDIPHSSARLPLTPASPAPRRASPWRRISLAGLMAAIALSAMLLIAWPHIRREPSQPSRTTAIAVLPFRTLGSEWDTVPRWVSESLHERLIHVLSSQPRLRVIARTSSTQVDGADLTEIAARLGVDAVLVGSVRAELDEYRVAVRLIDGARGQVLWSASVQRSRAEPLALEMQITGAVVARLTGLADPDGMARPPGSTRSEVAHAWLLHAMHLVNLRRGEDLRRAVEYLDLALGEDSTYGLAHALKAQTYMLMSTSRDLSPTEAAALAIASAEKALALDDRISSAHSALGAAHQANRNRAAAEHHFQRALALNPSDALTHSWYGFLLLYTGRSGAGMRELELAHQLDPLSIGVTANLGWGQYFTGRYDDAVATFGRLLTRDSALFPIYSGRGRSLQQLGRWDEALAHYRRAADMGRTQQGAAFLAQALARTGAVAEARAIRSDLEQTDRPDPIAMAIIDVGLGQIDSALGWLGLAAADRWYGFVQTAVDPVFDPIHRDPRYWDLLESVWLDS
jgi:DNA-binding SARP family transcriptional activator/TolB-like protein